MIVDPQYDFITGSLPVPGAVDAMNKLANFIRDNGYLYDGIIITADKHPINHCSFQQSGGEWPRHCVAESCGAAVWQPLLESLYDYKGEITFLHKGERPDIEEYSIFKNRSASDKILDIINNNGVQRIDVCGLAGDICVASTVRDGIKLLGNDKFRILPEFSPSLDDGSTLAGIINELTQ